LTGQSRVEVGAGLEALGQSKGALQVCPPWPCGWRDQPQCWISHV